MSKSKSQLAALVKIKKLAEAVLDEHDSQSKKKKKKQKKKKK